jgi:hypothetical protein
VQSRATRDEWRKRVRAWKASGLSCAQFAGRAGIHAGTLSWWRWKLGTEGSERRGGQRRVPPRVAFVELTPAPPREAASGCECLELTVGGITLRVPDRFEAQTLARVLEVLEARR